ncbi:MAG TPA: hypothetical protein VIW21_01310 [Chthoniobacterales bacterium]|jgi:hypothetical protein
MVAIVINPLIIMFLLWLFARHEAERSYITVLLVTIGLTMLALLIGFQYRLLGFVVYLALLPFALTRFCYVSFPKASIVTVLFLGWQLLFSFAVASILRSASLPAR